MGYLALIIVGLIALMEAFAIWALLNRVLVQAKVPPLELPQIRQPDGIPELIERRKKIFEVPIGD